MATPCWHEYCQAVGTQCNPGCGKRTRPDGSVVVQHKKDFGHRPCAQSWGGWERARQLSRQVTVVRGTALPQLDTPHRLPEYLDALLALEHYGVGNSASSTSQSLQGERERSQGLPEARKALKLMLAQCSEDCLGLVSQLQDKVRGVLTCFRHPTVEVFWGSVVAMCQEILDKAQAASVTCKPAKRQRRQRRRSERVEAGKTREESLFFTMPADSCCCKGGLSPTCKTRPICHGSACFSPLP